MTESSRKPRRRKPKPLLALRVKLLRHGITLTEVSDESGVALPHVSLVLSGRKVWQHVVDTAERLVAERRQNGRRS